ncbi:DUF6701 domain-containing protein [Ferrimonas balearica]|uniref:DUF6701 domain-containing protein n=1 Tax=Ferrimonas balearica TaxID=44012 RepID=UPI001C9A1A54|nr:DUF6701 domain-containing protein [Ferrimonas balearica]MBY5922497.1 hypothetical protein [Ferrimonas balearica]MBY5995481.1 hypothetical protein [Ferrimonas balearica]
MTKRWLLALLCWLLWAPFSYASLPQCDLIFTKPPSGDHGGEINLPPNDTSDGSLYIGAKCGGGGLCNSPYHLSPARDYFLDTLSLVGHGRRAAQLHVPDTPPGTSTRLYVNHLVIDHGAINWDGAPEDLVIIVYGSVSLTQAQIKGILYADNDVQLTGQVQFEGAIAAGDDYFAAGNSNIDIDLDALEDGDLSDICDNGQNPDPVYYRIEHDGQGVTCQGEPVTISVCNDSACNSLSSETVNVTLTPTTGWEGGRQVSVTGQTTRVLWSGQPGSVNVGLTGSIAGTVTCLVGGTEVAPEQCNIQYERSALLLEPGAPLGCRDETLVVKAVRASDSDPRQCVPAMTGNQAVDFTLAALNPSAPVGSPVFTLAGQALPFGSTQSRTLRFNAEGQAAIPANYSDVGQLRLSARYRAEHTGETIELDGQSDFVVAPAGLHLSSPDAQAQCASGDASCSAFVTAGTDFNLSVTAACWQSDDDTDFSDNPVARNFQHNGVPLEPELVAPLNGQPSTTGSLSIPVSQNGTGTAPTQISEVGAFRWQLAADGFGLRQIDYLGRSVSAVSADTLGRFTPAYLAVVPNVPSLAGCNAMGYLAQPLDFATPPRLTVQGINANGLVTRNYNSEFWRLTTTLTPRHYADESGRPEVDEVIAGTLMEESAGDPALDRVLWLDGTQIAYRRSSTLVAPFDAALDLTLDASALTDLDGICYGDGSACLPLRIEDVGGVALRYGRLALDNVYGSEHQALTLPVRAEYFDGGQFVRNELDSCTPYVATDLTFASGSLTASGAGLLASGRGRLTINPAGSALDTLAEYQLAYPHYLQWYWGRAAAQDVVGRQCVESDGTTDRLCNPKARVTFGRYRGHDKVIFRRERLSD